MNSEERDLISRFVARVGAGHSAPGAQGGQVALAPIDPEADRFIAENFEKYPEARYRITQLAVVQEAALSQAQNRIRDLEFQLQQARSQLMQNNQQQQSGGFLGGLFGGRKTPQQAPNAYPPGWGPQANMAQRPPMPQGGYQNGYAPPPGYQPGMFQRSGSGFLGSALSTAAGVAGGMMAANALEGLFSGHHGAAAGGADNAAGFGGDNAAGAAGGFGGSDPFDGAGTEGSGFSDGDFSQSGSDDFFGNDSGGFDGDFGGDFDGGGFDDF
ncbi:DUF2076 domain-containing protein [Aristophania vespae]|uniref:DUF2076 domain-containing protein n=1 Tax=Aristophania vespae TaxID=2697033 RepID=UPI00235122E1|nr:DUF2076 domain-containing protein [Aristophania vespae]UMM64544.1 hypothetical protein DM15PD_15600 [Aristophania vespae]